MCIKDITFRLFRQGMEKALAIHLGMCYYIGDVEKAVIGLPCNGLRFQRERDGGIRPRALPGFLPGASA